ncbi:MAG: L-histidine N(alpha)-methyltransferase [Thermoleophilaceae bacterium]
MRGLIESHLTEGALDSLPADVRHGLELPLKEIPPKYFYDARGSELFEQITSLPEYYPSRCERALLNRHAPEIVQVTGAEELVELGSGTASKTRALLYAMAGRGRLRSYIPFDCSESVVRECVELLEELFPGVWLHGVVGDFESHLEKIPPGNNRLIAFLGGTIGNLYPLERSMFLERIGASGDWLLLGTDLVKDARVIEAAYNDESGVTAQFNKNVLYAINRELEADFDPEAFEHVAFFDRDNEWVEMRLRACSAQSVSIPGADIEVAIAAGEDIRTEISAKFTPERIAAELNAAGFDLKRFYTDGLFGLSLAQRL